MDEFTRFYLERYTRTTLYLRKLCKKYSLSTSIPP
jgi:hypothetical protein